jgi:hypothetical protein
MVRLYRGIYEMLILRLFYVNLRKGSDNWEMLNKIIDVSCQVIQNRLRFRCMFGMRFLIFQKPH